MKMDLQATLFKENLGDPKQGRWAAFYGYTKNREVLMPHCPELHEVYLKSNVLSCQVRSVFSYSSTLGIF